jgi:hypothetical protein
MKVIENAKLIKNVIKDLVAENVVIEICDERYDQEMIEII